MNSMFNERKLGVVIKQSKSLTADLSKYSEELDKTRWFNFLWVHNHMFWESGINATSGLISVVGKITEAFNSINNRWYSDNTSDSVRFKHHSDVSAVLSKNICMIAEPEIKDISEKDLISIKNDIIPKAISRTIQTATADSKITNETISMALEIIFADTPELKKYKQGVRVLFCQALLNELEEKGSVVNNMTGEISKAEMSQVDGRAMTL